MKEVKIYVHRARAADVVQALVAAGFGPLSIVDVKGMLSALNEREIEYSTELAARIISEVKIEFVCDPKEVESAIQLIEVHAQTGGRESGAVYVSDVELALQF